MAIDQSLLVKVKNNLRISHNALDDDLSDTVAACLRDLEIYGIQVPTPDDPQETDPLILNAIKLYTKAETTDDPTKAAAYRERYNALKSCLGMAGEYKEGAADE